MQETWSLSLLGLANTQSIMYTQGWI